MCLQRNQGLIQRDNISLHFLVCMGFFLCELVVFLLVSRFFWDDRWDLYEFSEEEKHAEHSFRSYLIINTACLVSFMCYLVFVLRESYQQAYWAIFVASLFYIYSHCFIVAKLQELLTIQRFEKFQYDFVYVAGVSFLGVTCLIINTLILADQE